MLFSRIALVVDDEQALLGVYQLALQDLGLDCAVYADGEAALARARQQPFDVIVLDHRMPGLSGVEWARRYRETEGYSTPILLVTAARGIEEKALRAGVTAILEKPFDIHALNEFVAGWSGGGSALSA